MENASKALLIAGSVLIAILLIALGVRIINSTQGTTDAAEGTMQSTEVAMFNNKFTQHIGSNKNYSQVMALVDLISITNSTSERKVWLTVKNQTTGERKNYLYLPKELEALNNDLAKYENCSFNISLTVDSYNSDGSIKRLFVTFKTS